MKCNEGNIVFEVRGGSFESYSLILVPHNFSGPQFSDLGNEVMVRIK